MLIILGKRKERERKGRCRCSEQAWRIAGKRERGWKRAQYPSKGEDGGKCKGSDGNHCAECFLRFYSFWGLLPTSLAHRLSHAFLLWYYHFSPASSEHCTISTFLKAPMAMSSNFLPSSWNLRCRTSALFLSVVLIPAQILTTEASPLFGEYLFLLVVIFPVHLEES